MPKLNTLESVLPSVTNGTDCDLTMTWGLKQTGVSNTRYTGKGIKVAVLDTGLNLHHPDFNTRVIHSKSFAVNETVHDGNGHGTHCAGIVFGSDKSSKRLCYGVAPGAEIYIAKVLPDSGMANTRYVLQGLEWALEMKCQIISLSLGNKVRYGENHSPSFEQLAQQALAQGSLIIASAGNDSYRDIDRLSPISHPANCPSILAVGAVDELGKMYERCNRSFNSAGGKMDLVAPGVDIYSAWLPPENYRSLDGTSMASSFVAGVAALWAEAYPGIGAEELKDKLLSAAKDMKLPKEDMGEGLVQVPKIIDKNQGTFSTS